MSKPDMTPWFQDLTVEQSEERSECSYVAQGGLRVTVDLGRLQASSLLERLERRHPTDLAELSRLQEEVEACNMHLDAAYDAACLSKVSSRPLAAVISSLQARVEMLEGATRRWLKVSAPKIYLGNPGEAADAWQALTKALAALPASATSEGDGHV